MEKRHPKKFFAAKPLADFLKDALDPLFARRGFSQSDLILYWEEIAGKNLAEKSQPVKLAWPARGLRDEKALATLFLQVEPGFALEFQHLGPVIMDRVNTHLGWRCVGKLTLKQGPLERSSSRRRTGRTLPSPQALRAASELVKAIDDEALRAALTRLGAQIIRGENRN